MPSSAFQGTTLIDGAFLAQNGSEATPSYSFSSTKTVGIYRLPSYLGGFNPNSGLAISTSAVTRMAIDSNGIVAVGRIPDDVKANGYFFGGGPAVENLFTPAKFNILTQGTSNDSNLFKFSFTNTSSARRHDHFVGTGSGSTGTYPSAGSLSTLTLSPGRSLEWNSNLTGYGGPEASSGEFRWNNTYSSMTFDFLGRLLVGMNSGFAIPWVYGNLEWPRVCVGGSAYFSDGIVMGGGTINVTTSSSPFFKTYVSGNNYYILGVNTTNQSGPGVYLSVGGTSWTAYSDERLKNITGTFENPLNDIMKIKPIKFTWKNDDNNTPRVGVSAQSVQLVLPEAIDEQKLNAEDTTTYLGVRYTEMIPLLIAAIQELKKQNDELQLKILEKQ